MKSAQGAARTSLCPKQCVAPPSVVRRLITLAAFLPCVGAAASVSIQLDHGVFKVIGWQATSQPPSGWASIFTVSTGPDLPPLFGSYSVENATLTFHPRYPLATGVIYHAAFRAPGAPAIDAVFHGPTPVSAPAARVVAMYPSAAILPSNQLKLYVLFSAPMSGGDIWPKIHLIDENGTPAVRPFVELDPALWNRDFTRLTLLFDPGRIKRGVKPNVDMGPVLVEGKRYTLVIDRELKDGNGRPLVESFRHEFSAGPAERRGIDPKLWRLSEPLARTNDPLVVKFDRPLDYALLGDVFQVTGPPGSASIKGSASIAPGETEWRFQPAQPWKPGQHHLVIDMALEDLAGNRIGRPFDVDTLVSPSPRITSQTTSLTFHTR